MKFGQLIFCKIIKIIATRDFNAKIHQIRFWLGLHHRPRWGSLQHAPYRTAGFNGAAVAGRGKEGREREGMEDGRGKVRGGRDGTGHGMGREGNGGTKREERGYSPPPPKLQFLAPPPALMASKVRSQLGLVNV